VELEIENTDKWILKKGDSFYIKAKSHHRLTNIGKSILRQLTVEQQFP
jgi:mannose-6-phosphate isomerase-like protein (cupin superfamily)